LGLGGRLAGFEETLHYVNCEIHRDFPILDFDDWSRASDLCPTRLRVREGHWLIYRSCSRPLHVNDGDCHPGFERPLHRTELPGYYTALKSQIRDLKLKLNRWAVAPGLLFIEWTVTGEIAGKSLVLPNTDRFTLREMLATEGVAYFDNLALRTLTEPGLSRLGNVSIGNVSTSDPESSR
jgi:hypothetical protein